MGVSLGNKLKTDKGNLGSPWFSYLTGPLGGLFAVNPF